MTRTSSRLPWAAWTLSAALALGALGALGCGGAFSNAMERGELFAQVGNWDAAAASFETAVGLDPGSAEARAMLHRARQMQAMNRVTASRKHLERGELALATITSREAMLLDPANLEAKNLYIEARKQTLAKAEALLAEKKGKEALELARAVRRGDPADPQAADLEGRCLDFIAATAYDQALAYAAQNKLGNALFSLREAQAARPGFRDSVARESAARTALED
jgi:tetratricopeptide (TPR) repeat protein